MQIQNFLHKNASLRRTHRRERTKKHNILVSNIFWTYLPISKAYTVSSDLSKTKNVSKIFVLVRFLNEKSSGTCNSYRLYGSYLRDSQRDRFSQDRRTNLMDTTRSFIELPLLR